MTSIWKNVYIDKLGEIVVKRYKNTYHRTITMKPVYVDLSIYIYLDKENVKEVKAYDLRLLISQSYFFSDAAQNYWIF